MGRTFSAASTAEPPRLQTRVVKSQASWSLTTSHRPVLNATTVSRPFLHQISPIFRHFLPVLSVSAPENRTAQRNGGKTAQNGRKTAKKARAGWGWDTIAREDQHTVRRPQRHVDRVWLHAQPRCKRQIPKPEARQMLSLCGVASGTGSQLILPALPCSHVLDHISPISPPFPPFFARFHRLDEAVPTSHKPEPRAKRQRSS